MKYAIPGLNKYPNGVVIWGLRTQQDTFRYIYHHFYTTLKKLGQKVVWVDDTPDSKSAVRPGSLVIVANVAAKYLPIVGGASYCLHNFDDEFQSKFDPRKFIRLQVYTKPVENDADNHAWNSATYFNTKQQTLYQPWGTNLLPHEFKKPTTGKLPLVFWVGSIWDNELHQGNLKEINILNKSLRGHGIRFIHLHGVPDWVNTAAVRSSKISPAIAGEMQVRVNYLPCRMFKNISYGQLGISNVKKFEDILVGCSVKGKSIEEHIENALALSKKQRLELTAQQQKFIKEHTYVQKLQNIVKALEMVAK